MPIKIIGIEQDTSSSFIQNAWWVTLEKETRDRLTVSVRADSTPTTKDIRDALLKSMEFLEVNYNPFIIGLPKSDLGVDDYKRELRSWLPEEE